MTERDSRFVIDTPFGRTPGLGGWDESRVVGLFGAPTTIPASEDEIEVIMAQGDTGDSWDGMEAGIVLLKDGRLMAWETMYGPTGSGFSADAYGGDAMVVFAYPGRLPALYNELTETGRMLLGRFLGADDVAVQVKGVNE